MDGVKNSISYFAHSIVKAESLKISLNETPRENVSPNSKQPLSIEDFAVGPLLGEGAYAQVRICQRRKSEEQFAVKIMDKAFLRKEKKIHYAKTEREVLSRVNHPFIIHLHYSFQDEKYLYMVIDLCTRGSLIDVIEHYKHINEKTDPEHAIPLDVLKWYISEIINVLEYLHCDMDIVHRDIKPENILIGEDGHIKLCDFATCLLQQRTNSYRDRQYSFCGTANYASPEMLNDEPLGSGVDIWSIGCLLYQMYTGKFPFDGENEYLLFELILEFAKNPKLQFPEDTPKELSDLIYLLLLPNPHERLGSKFGGIADDFKELKAHAFFKDVNFSLSYLKEQKPLYLPPLHEFPLTPENLANFNELFNDHVDKFVLDEIESARSSKLEDNNNNHNNSSSGNGSRSNSSLPQVPIGNNNNNSNGLSSPSNNRYSSPTQSKYLNKSPASVDTPLSEPSSSSNTNTPINNNNDNYVSKSRGNSVSLDYVFESLLMKNENMILSGTVKEKFLIFTKSRQLILTNFRLMILDPLDIKVESQIDLNKKEKKLKIMKKGESSFEIVDFLKSYSFKNCVEPTVDEWIKGINNVIQSCN